MRDTIFYPEPLPDDDPLRGDPESPEVRHLLAIIRKRDLRRKYRPSDAWDGDTDRTTRFGE